jgi:hypothetical protein
MGIDERRERFIIIHAPGEDERNGQEARTEDMPGIGEPESYVSSSRTLACSPAPMRLARSRNMS